MLRVIRGLAAEHDIEISPTFMGAHEVPVEYREHRRAYIDLVIGEMIPVVAREGLAEWCDVFCEHGVFTADESREILQAARDAGMKLRIHADEFGLSGGSQRRRRSRGPVRGSSDLRRPGRRPGPGGRGRRRDAAADRVVLSEARPIRARPHADRPRRRRGARHRRQPRRRFFAVDAVCDGARLLRHGPDLRGSAGRRDDQRRLFARSPYRWSAASNRASRWTR